MFQYIRYDIRQIILRHNFLLVAQLCDTFRHSSLLLGRQFQTQFLQILGNVGTTALLA